MAHRNRIMKPNENLDWNSYHSSPTEIRMHIDYLRTKSIKQLIQLMDICYDDAKKYESEEWFYKWNPDDDWGVEFRYIDYRYEDNLCKISHICGLIKEKRDSMHAYCDPSPRREEFHGYSESIKAVIRKTPGITYNEIISELGKDAVFALNYLIESEVIEYKGKKDNAYWKIVK